MEEKMKVCLFCESFLPQVGGKEWVIHHLANALCDIGCEVTVIAKKMPGKLKLQNKYKLARYWKLFPGSGRTGFDFLAAVITLYRENQQNRFDIINCHGVGFEAGRVMAAKRFMKVPVIMTPHGNDLYKIPALHYGNRMNKRYDRIMKNNLQTCDAITAISTSIKEKLALLTNKNIFLIPNGIDRNLFLKQKIDYLQKMISLDPKYKIVLSVGRNVMQKDYESGIRAFEILNHTEQGKELVYVIIGKDTHFLEDMVRNLKLKDKVFLIPQQSQENIIKCYQSAWCFFSPSIIEGLSLVSLEAMATGLPLVLTKVPGNIDIINGNHCGIFVNKEDPESMANGLLSLAFDKGLYDDLSNKSYVQSFQYDWPNIANKYLEAYENVIDHHNHPKM